MYSYKCAKYKQLRVFKLKFDRCEFDMVIYDPETATCRLFEIKHTTERDDSQLRHLLDLDRLAYAEQNYGEILSCEVLSRGENRGPFCGVEHMDVQAAYLNGHDGVE